MKKAATRAEKHHMAKVAAVGCVVCHNNGYPDTPCEVHHIGGQYGVRASHWETIGLCPYHHRHGPHGEAVHSGRRAFEARHGTEKELLARVNRLLEDT